MSVYICAPFERNGSIAQLVQSICLTSRGSQVRILLLPQKSPHGDFFLPMHPLSIQIQEHTFELHPLKAMWWKKHSVLICADVHIGKGAHFRTSGIPIPKRVNDANLWNLVVLIEHYQPEKVLFLGDLFHSNMNHEWEELRDCLAQFPTTKKLLVKGNHEIEANLEYERMGFEVHESLRLDDVIFMHEPPIVIPPNAYTFCGHLHPAVRMSGNAQQSLRLPCYWMGEKIGVIPAFGEFTGSHTIQPKKGDQLFVIADNSVVKIS
jgi:DNA ligase-associated metallophosphoesterase